MSRPERVTVCFCHFTKSPTYGDADIDCIADVEVSKEDFEIVSVRVDAEDGELLPDLLEMLRDGQLPKLADDIEMKAREALNDKWAAQAEDADEARAEAARDR